jgi:hypothetical protein
MRGGSTLKSGGGQRARLQVGRQLLQGGEGALAVPPETVPLLRLVQRRQGARLAPVGASSGAAPAPAGRGAGQRILRSQAAAKERRAHRCGGRRRGLPAARPQAPLLLLLLLLHGRHDRQPVLLRVPHAPQRRRRRQPPQQRGRPGGGAAQAEGLGRSRHVPAIQGAPCEGWVGGLAVGAGQGGGGGQPVLGLQVVWRGTGRGGG